MNNIFDSSSVELTLRHGIEKGLWTLEQLDQPSPGYQLCLREARRNKFFGFDFFPPVPYANPLRQTKTVEVVAANVPIPDLASAIRANEGQPDVDLSQPQRSTLPGERHPVDWCGEQNRETDGGDHGQQGDVGATRQHPAPDLGGIRQPTLESEPTAEPASTAPW